MSSLGCDFESEEIESPSRYTAYVVPQELANEPPADTPPSASAGPQTYAAPESIVIPEESETEQGEPNKLQHLVIVQNLQEMLLVMQSWRVEPDKADSKYLAQAFEGKADLEFKATMLMTRCESPDLNPESTAAGDTMTDYTQIADEYEELAAIFSSVRPDKVPKTA